MTGWASQKPRLQVGLAGSVQSVSSVAFVHGVHPAGALLLLIRASK
jgi:hypothetical protein